MAADASRTLITTPRPHAHHAGGLFGQRAPDQVREVESNVGGRGRGGHRQGRTSPGRRSSAAERRQEERLDRIAREAERLYNVGTGEKKAPRQPPPPQPIALGCELDFRHSTWWTRRRLVQDAMSRAGYTATRRERFDNCGAGCTVEENADTGDLRCRAFYCHDRWCEACSQARTLTIADNLMERLAASTVPGVHIVLTLKHQAGELAPQLDRLLRCFRTLRSRPWWRARVSGGAFFPQLHISQADGLWHVHLHAIGESYFLDELELSTIWHGITGDSFNVNVSRIRDGRAIAREVTRYVAKPVDGNTTSDADQLAEMMRALTGRRLCSTFGSWRGWRLTARPAPDPGERWIPIAPLAQIIRRANAGDDYAAHVLDVLYRRISPSRGPPTLAHLADGANCADGALFTTPAPT